MDNRDLTPEQARAVMETVGGYLAYLGRLRRRMDVCPPPPGEPRYAIMAAFDALQK